MSNTRLLFDDLIELNKAAESCHGLAIEFVRDFSEPPESSVCNDVAHSRARERLGHAETAVEGLKAAITKWDLSPNKGAALQRIAQGIGLSQPIICIGDRSYLTAHEASHAIAAETISVAGRLNGRTGDPQRIVDDLADRLRGLSVPDLSARIEGEFWEASKLIEVDTPDDPATVPSNGPTPPLPILDPVDVEILKVLAENPGVAVFQADLVANRRLDIDRKTAGKRLNYLRDIGYVAHPPHRSKADAITDAGLTRLKIIFASSP